MSVAYLALGSNLGDRLDHLRAGKEALATHLELQAISPVYETEPVDAGSELFLNAVLCVRTERSPQELLALCLDIEQANGRVRTGKNSPRTLDIDVLLYDDTILHTADLVLPHPRLHQRAFVLMPLSAIAPDLAHPVLGSSMRELLAQLGPTGALVRRTDHSL